MEHVLLSCHLCIVILAFLAYLYQSLSERDHLVDGVHNYEYDHEAFLGKDMEEQFHKLKPEESKRRLGWVSI